MEKNIVRVVREGLLVTVSEDVVVVAVDLEDITAVVVEVVHLREERKKMALKKMEVILAKDGSEIVQDLSEDVEVAAVAELDPARGKKWMEK